MNKTGIQGKQLFLAAFLFSIAIPNAYAKVQSKCYEEQALDVLENGLHKSMDTAQAIQEKISGLKKHPTSLYEDYRDALIEKVTKHASVQAFLESVVDNIPALAGYGFGYKVSWDLTDLNPAKAIEAVVKGDGLSEYVPVKFDSHHSPKVYSSVFNHLKTEVWNGNGKIKSISTNCPVVPLTAKFLLSGKNPSAFVSGGSAFSGARILSAKAAEKYFNKTANAKEEAKAVFATNIGMGTMAGYAFKVAYDKNRSKSARLRALVSIGAFQAIQLRNSLCADEYTNTGVALAGLATTYKHIQEVRNEQV